MTRSFKTLLTTGLAVLIMSVACTTGDVAANTEGQSDLTPEAQLTCPHANAANRDKSGKCDMQGECPADKQACCKKDKAGKVCPVTGAVDDDNN